MLRTTRLLHLLPVLLLPAGVAFAQQKPSEAPPKLEVIEEGSDTPITVTPPKSGGAAKIIEKKEGGRVTEVKVKAGPSTYTMKPPRPGAPASPRDNPASQLTGPQWTVGTFDLSKKKKTDKEAVPDAPDAPPPPAPQPASK